jgi:hypothetical protein
VARTVAAASVSSIRIEMSRVTDGYRGSGSTRLLPSAPRLRRVEIDLGNVDGS